MCKKLFAVLVGLTVHWFAGHAVAQSPSSEAVTGEAAVASDAEAASTPVTNSASKERTSDYALAIVNQKRSRRGLYPLNFDPQLTAAAQFKSHNRASRRITGHDGTSMCGARTEGVGYASGQSNLAGRFQTCHLYTTSYRNAGAGIAYDSCGRAYYTLLLR